MESLTPPPVPLTERRLWTDIRHLILLSTRVRDERDQDRRQVFAHQRDRAIRALAREGAPRDALMALTGLSRGTIAEILSTARS